MVKTCNLQKFLDDTPEKDLTASFKKVINYFIDSKDAFSKGSGPKYHFTDSKGSSPKYHFTESIKPEKQYFKKMFDLTNPDDTIIFFDDKKVNVDAAREYGQTTNRKIFAVQVKSINDMVSFLKEHNIITQKEASTIGWHAFGNKINRWLGYPDAYIFSAPSLLLGTAMFSYLLTKVDKR